MPRLFYKIFLWFWLSIVVVSITLLALTASTRSRSVQDERWHNKYGPRVDLWARQESEILDHEGQSALRKYVRSFESDPGVRNYLFDADGEELLTRQAPSIVHQTVAAVFQSQGNQEQFFTAQRMIAEKVAGPGGKPYVVVVTFPQPSILRRRLFEFFDDLGSDGVIRFGTILLVAGLFCFWLTRQITSPIDKLRLATREIATEHLETRVDKRVTSRRDELAELARDFDRMAERINGLVASHRRLLSDVSHALRSPLARLSVALGLARQRANPEIAEHLDRIERETERLNKLIGQLLTLARIDSAVDLEKKTVFELGMLLHEVAADGDYEARSRGCRVALSTSVECQIEGAPEMLRGAIENVVRNAVRHTAKGSNVEITMELRHLHRAVIEVRDHGQGVPEDALADLFLPFHRVTDGVSRDPGRAGLGLAITERALRSHGGTAAASNAPGGGLVVTLELPIVSYTNLLQNVCVPVLTA
jgi:two-component system sensor histidine kinase CpxA